MIVAPAMNNAMYERPAAQANLAILRARGVIVLEPGTGLIGSPGEFGIGRLPEPPELLDAVEARCTQVGTWTAPGARHRRRHARADRRRALRRQPLVGAHGHRAGAEAQRRGANVTVVAANVSIPRPAGIEYLDVQTAAELADACAARFDACDVLLMAAAVADYRPADAHAGKLKKDQTGQELNLRLTRTEDVLSSLATRRRPGQFLVGFAAEHGDGALAYGRDKLTRKGLDAVIVNDIGGAGIGFDQPTTKSGSSRKTATSTWPGHRRLASPQRSWTPS